MARAHVLVAFAAALMMMSPRISQAVGEESPIRLVSTGSGALAAAPPAGTPWTVLQAGDPLPPRCKLRSAAGGVCELQLPSGLLLIAGGSQLELDAAQQNVVLVFGRVSLQSGDQAASCEAGGAHCSVAANSKIEVASSADSTSIAVVKGSVAVMHPDRPPLMLAEQQTVAWKDSDNAWAPRPLTEDEQRAIAAWTAARPAQGLGQLLINDAQSGSATRLNIARYHVNVVLEPPVALVQIDQSFYNPLPRQEEGTFVFNLPSGASVSRFAMYVTSNSLIEGELIERQKAAGIYQSIVNQRRDPAILEQIGDSLFKMRVFPVPPNDSKRILLDFTLPLETRDGQYVFRLPLLSDLKPIWDFRITGSLRGPTLPGSVQVDAPYDLHPAPQGDAIGFELRERLFQPQHDLTIRFRQKLDGAAVVRSFATNDHDPFEEKKTVYFWAALPPDALAGPPDISPADVLVLVDSSGSGQDRRQLTDALRTLLANLRPTDRFRLACTDITARALGDWQTAEPAHAATALAAFDKELFFGGVDLTTSLTQALKLQDTSKRRQLVVYLGAAAESVTPLPTGKFADSLRQQLIAAGVPFFVVTPQRASQGQPLLEAMAGASGGLVFDVSQAEGRQGFFAWLLAGLPLPTPIQWLEVAGAAAEDLFYPAAWPVGQILPITGRCSAGKLIEISAVLGRKGAERPMKLSLQRSGSQDDVFVGRCWAQRKLDALRAEQDQLAYPDDSLRRQIITLSQEWSLLSPLTAFLVLETEQDYTRWNISRQQRRRYWRPPAATVEAPLPEHWLRLVGPDRTALAHDSLRSGLVLARRALEQHRLELARQQLQRIEPLPGAVLSPEYKALVKQLQDQEVHRAQSIAMHARRELLEANQRADEELQNPPQLARLLVGEISSDFLERFPLAGRLLQNARANNPAAAIKAGNLVEPLTLEDFCKHLETSTGISVWLDKKALEDAGAYSTKTPINPLLHNSAPMSWRSYLRLTLPPMDLAYCESRHGLTITTREKADANLSLELYPVADLLLADRQPDRELLSNPYLDLQLASEARIKSKLKQTVSVSFDETSLDDVAEYFSAKLGINVVLDAKALGDAGASTDAPVTAWLRGEPASESLRLMLGPADLGYIIRDEALVITTKEKVDGTLHLRLHNGAGLVYESTRPAALGMQGMGARGRMTGGTFGGSGGGMFGGSGGGMGGMGGGMGGMMGGMAGTMGVSGAPAQSVRGLQDDSPASPAGSVASSSASTPEISTQIAGLNLRISQSQEVRGREHGSPAKVAALDVSPPITAAPLAAGMTGPRVTSFDTDTLVDLVTTTISPTTWDEVGGPGNIDFFAPTLDFVLSTTDDVHDQIDNLFSRLRKIPIISGASGGRAAQHGRPVTIEESPRALGSLVDIITSTCAPTTWDEVGGPGSIAEDRHRLALIISTTGEVHESVSELLTMLRRSRLEIPSRQPLEVFHAAGHGPLVDALAAAVGKARAARQPATPAELQLLGVRREPAGGSWQWRRTDDQGSKLAAFAVKRSAARLDVETPAWIARCEGENAAVAYPGLTLFERGPWASAVRELLDARLPWWPHRSNQELTELFEIEAAPSPPAEPAGAVWLRFHTPGTDQADYLQIAFSRDRGQPLLWQSYLGGKFFQSIRFAQPAPANAPAAPYATLETADGQALLHWQLTSQSADDPQLADLSAGWPDYVELHPAAGEGPLAKGLAAARRSDWPAAMRIFQAACQERPNQPLLATLWAWSVMRAASDSPQPTEGMKAIAIDEVVKVLQDVAREGAGGLMQFISRSNFPWLSAKEFHAVLEAQPAKLRADADWQRLIATASEARLVPQALAHATEAASFATDLDQQFACEQWKLEVLLAAKRSAEAARSATDWVRQHPQVRPAQLAVLACMLAEYGEGDAADPILRQALSAPDLPNDLKSQYARRYADSQHGLPRWRSLAAAIELAPSDGDSRIRRELASQLIAELNNAIAVEACEQLVKEILDRDLQARVQVLFAHMTPHKTLAADTFWALRESGLLPDVELVSACSIWNAANQPARTIGVLEAKLRQGTVPSLAAMEELAAAYRAAGRIQDAKRAESQPVKLQHSQSTPDQTPVRRGLGNGGGYF